MTSATYDEMCGPANPHSHHESAPIRLGGSSRIRSFGPAGSGLFADPNDETLGANDLALMFAVHISTLRVWIKSGMPAHRADHYAVRLVHRHPAQIWPNWFEDGLAVAS